MKVLILEDDELIADLLETVVSGLYAGAEIQLAGQLSDALDCWEKAAADLVIADWNLPDGSGLSLIKAVRRVSQSVPVVMISGRADRESILAAANLGINSYISKPFTVELVHQRLGKLIDPASVTDIGLPTLEERLASAAEAGVQMSGSVDAGTVLALFQRQDDLTPGQLAERWKQDAALTAKLLDVASRSSLKRSGQPVQSLKDAITTIGVPMALNQALALSMDMAGQLPDGRLKTLARDYQQQAEQVALQAQQLAARLGERGELHFTAGLLSRVGEMVVLRVIQQHLESGESLSDDQIRQAVSGWSQTLGNRVKIQWRLSLSLRELVGAIYLLQSDAVSRDRLIMRAAALKAAGEENTEQCRRLMRRLGFAESDEQDKDDAG
ncbi:response regulator [Marinobacter confluentis]|uniref:Response regulator n=1 Tax=Marinobacter confluentis TaxID=1697557 RepID=A0A4Z1BH77_9GAMM|nr:response regulator [Marinobacter confluentis]TGN38829.1 response regulator [Marinobacter confluentis]